MSKLANSLLFYIIADIITPQVFYIDSNYVKANLRPIKFLHWKSIIVYYVKYPTMISLANNLWYSGVECFKNTMFGTKYNHFLNMRF